MKIAFEKWHGTGNDFVFLNNWENALSPDPEQIKKICHRQFGIGADAVIYFEKSERADCKMNYFNADGSFSETCGNGLRCTAAYGLKHKFVPSHQVKIENPGGTIDIADVLSDSPWQIRVNMGSPKTKGLPDFPDDFLGKIVDVDGTEVKVWCVSMGNPHAVQFVDSVKNAPVLTQGSKIEYHKLFPNRINAEYVEVLSPTEANFRVWERGCGETLACGSGAAAAAVAGTLAGRFSPNAEILMHLPGGDLVLRWNQQKNAVYKTGSAQFVFAGEVEL